MKESHLLLRDSPFPKKNIAPGSQGRSVLSAAPDSQIKNYIKYIQSIS